MGTNIVVQPHTKMDFWLMVIDVDTRSQTARPKATYSTTLITIPLQGLLTGFKMSLFCPANAEAGSLNSKTRVGHTAGAPRLTRNDKQGRCAESRDVFATLGPSDASGVDNRSRITVALWKFAYRSGRRSCRMQLSVP